MRIKTASGLSVLKVPGEGLAIDVSHRSRSYDVDWLDAGVLSFLIACGTWTERAHAERLLAERTKLPDDARARAIDQLLELGVLVGEDDPFHARLGDAEAMWERYGWEDAFHLQREIGALERLDYLEDGFRRDVLQMKAALAADPKPANYKEFQGKGLIPLGPVPEVPQRSLCETFDGPGTTKAGPMDSGRFAWLTYFAYGQVGKKFMPVTKEHITKTSPSGGARHPTEVYPIVLEIEGIEPGLYHYNVKQHALELLVPGDHRAFVRRCLVRGTPPPFDYSVVYVYTTIFERSMFRYREPFSYRVMSHDIGHLLETTRLLANSIGRRVSGGRVPRDCEVNGLLGIDGLFESTMTYAVVE